VACPPVLGCPQDAASVAIPTSAEREKKRENFQKLDLVFMKISRSFSEKIGRRNDRKWSENIAKNRRKARRAGSFGLGGDLPTSATAELGRQPPLDRMLA
jgi:hypothetical protein